MPLDAPVTSAKGALAVVVATDMTSSLLGRRPPLPRRPVPSGYPTSPGSSRAVDYASRGYTGSSETFGGELMQTVTLPAPLRDRSLLLARHGYLFTAELDETERQVLYE